MSSPFSPEQKTLISVAAIFFALMACWVAFKAVRDHFGTGKPLRLAPLVTAILGLAVAVEAIMVVNLHPFFIQHPLRMPSVPMFGLLLVVVASAYDQHRAPPPEKPPKQYYLFRTQVDSADDITRALSSDGTLLGHLKSLARFYLGTLEVRIASRYGLEETLSRIRDLNNAHKVDVSERAPDKLIVCAASPRHNGQPSFQGTLSECNGRAFLEGRIGIDSNIAAFLALFGFVLLVLVLSALFTGKTWPDRLEGLIGPIVFLFLLEIGYAISKSNLQIIMKNLEHALRG